MITRRDVFQAIADPTRREIINLLARRSHNLSGVVDQFSVSRPAIAKHLRILAECGLVEVHEKGREKYFHARLQGLREVADWSEQYQVFWTRTLDALGDLLERTASPPRKAKKTRSTTKKKKT